MLFRSEQVVLCAEVAEMLVAIPFGLRSAFLHFLAVVAMKAVAFDDGGLDAFSPKNIGESAGDRAGAGARGACDGNDGVTFRHGRLSKVRFQSRNKLRSENKGLSTCLRAGSW